MELVYLWVEEYKNIKNQGFNFSPRFDCKYDKDTNELTIDENKDYVSIFPENINVTAIVGENGSGKSSIAELLGEFNWNEFHKPNKNFLIFFDNNKFIFRCNLTGSDLYFNIKNNTKYKNTTTSWRRELFISYFANNISTFLNKDLPLSYKTYDRFDAMKDNTKQHLMENNKLNIYREKILEYELFNKRFSEILYGDENLFQQINQNFIFNNKKREIHFYEIGALTVGEDNPINELFKESPYTGRTLFDDKETIEDTPHNTYFFKYLILNRLIFLNDIEKDSEMVIEKIKETFQKEVFEDVDYTNIIDTIHEANPIKDEQYNIKNVKELFKCFEYKGKNIWIEKNDAAVNDNIPNTNSLLKTINQYNTIRTNYFHNDNEEYNYLSLSSGEREYIKLFTHYIYHLKNGERRDVFYFDEPDLALHPNWQKKLIKDFIYFAEKFTSGKEIQLILTSHSPFILSDIPKENVIFLQNFEQKKPFKKSEQTFGANIHTLLSHGFFMDKGLMGEFAKERINEAIELLKKDVLLEDEIKFCTHIISIIGEPILQRTLQSQLNKKLYQDETELQKLEREKKELQNKIDKLKEKKNETN